MSPTAAAGQFKVIPIETADQGIALLTGVPAGEPDGTGQYPEGTINRRVATRLAAFARQSQPPRRERATRRRRGRERSDGK